MIDKFNCERTVKNSQQNNKKHKQLQMHVGQKIEGNRKGKLLTRVADMLKSLKILHTSRDNT